MKKIKEKKEKEISKQYKNIYKEIQAAVKKEIELNREIHDNLNKDKTALKMIRF